MILNEGQKLASQMIDDWLNDDSEPFMYLIGLSGSGKSSVVANKFQELGISNYNCCVTAPTNEAVEVISEDMPEFDAKTIYSLLGFRPTATSSEDQIIVRAGSYKVGGVWIEPPPKQLDYKIIILDEAPYTPNQLIEHILAHHSKTKWLLMGDPEQLKALKDDERILCKKAKKFKYQIELLEDMRSVCPLQKERMLLARDQKRNMDLSDSVISKSKAMKNILNYFDSKDCDPKKGGDPLNFNFLALAYNHYVVNKIAADLRDILFDIAPDQPPQAGEVIRVSEVLDHEGEQLVRTNERVRVLSFFGDYIKVERKNGEQTYLDIDNKGYLENLYKIACAAANSKDWGNYHRENRRFVKISSAYALTAHSAQGRTAEHTLVHIENVKAAINDGLFYVALGRSRQLAWLVNSW
jgi:hypothetical protein